MAEVNKNLTAALKEIDPKNSLENATSKKRLTWQTPTSPKQNTNDSDRALPGYISENDKTKDHPEISPQNNSSPVSVPLSTFKKVPSYTGNTVKLKDLPRSSVAFKSFQVFCKKEFSDENLKFSQEMDDLLAQLAPVSQNQKLEMQKRLKSIYDRFIAPNAESPVTLAFSMQNAFVTQNRQYEKTIASGKPMNEDCFILEHFKRLRKDIGNVLEQDTFSRFLKTNSVVEPETSNRPDRPEMPAFNLNSSHETIVSNLSINNLNINNPNIDNLNINPMEKSFDSTPDTTQKNTPIAISPLPTKQFLVVNNVILAQQKTQHEKVNHLYTILKNYLEIHKADANKKVNCCFAYCTLDKKQIYENLNSLYQELTPYIINPRIHIWETTKILKFVTLRSDSHRRLLGKTKDAILQALEETLKVLKFVVPPSPTLNTPNQ